MRATSVCFFLAWQNWYSLTKEPFRKWIGAFLGMPLFELFQYGGGYLATLGAFLLIRATLLGNSRRLRPLLLLGAFCGGGWYFLIALLTNSLWRHAAASTQAGIYTVTGLLFAYLYYRWVLAESTQEKPVTAE